MPIRIAPNSEFTEADKPNRIRRNALSVLNPQPNGPIHVVIENGITEIGEAAFANCILLESIELPIIIEVGEDAFLNCPNLRQVVLRGESQKSVVIHLTQDVVPPIPAENIDNGGGHLDVRACIAEIFQIPEENRNPAVDSIIHTIYDWMLIPYDWDGDEITTIYLFDKYSRLVRRQDDPSKIIGISQILKWGHVNQHWDSIIPEFYYKLSNSENVRMLRERNFGEAAKMVKKQSRDRIASWSKILAGYMPGTFFIYDARVAFALSYLSLNNNLPCFWKIPRPNTGEGPHTLAIHNFILNQHVPQSVRGARDGLQAISENRNLHQISSRSAGIHVCYSRYHAFLRCLAQHDTIRDAYGQLDTEIQQAYANIGLTTEEAIMAHLEKVLFMQKVIPGSILRRL